jgi:glycerophosphoryl diester phosphodiesterase
VLRLAHRGQHRRLPENTLAALAAALAIPGCDGLEFDVRSSADGVPVLLHDATLDRVFGRVEACRALTGRELGAIGVPTLIDALAIAPPPAFLDVELKEDVVDRSVAAIAASRGDPPEATVISSFSARVVGRVAAVAPGWPTWLNSSEFSAETVAAAVGLGCVGVSVQWRAIGPTSFRRASDAGLAVAAWTVRRPSTVARLERVGVIAACVEGPALTASRPMPYRLET